MCLHTNRWWIRLCRASTLKFWETAGNANVKASKSALPYVGWQVTRWRNFPVLKTEGYRWLKKVRTTLCLLFGEYPRDILFLCSYFILLFCLASSVLLCLCHAIILHRSSGQQHSFLQWIFRNGQVLYLGSDFLHFVHVFIHKLLLLGTSNTKQQYQQLGNIYISLHFMGQKFDLRVYVLETFVSANHHYYARNGLPCLNVQLLLSSSPSTSHWRPGYTEVDLLAFLVHDLLWIAEMIAVSYLSLGATKKGKKRTVQFYCLVLVASDKPCHFWLLQTPVGFSSPIAAAVTLPLSSLFSLENWHHQITGNVSLKNQLGLKLKCQSWLYC